jgi:NAD(P)-dependent dehydrogenase (short-subunit alcohol dehydrogenase family)
VINIVTRQVAVIAATYSAYAGSKGPAEHFTKAFAKEVGSRGVTVNCIAPGPQKTSFLSGQRTTKDAGERARTGSRTDTILRCLANPQWRSSPAQRPGSALASPGAWLRTG